MKRLLLPLAALILSGSTWQTAAGQSIWQAPYRDRQVIIDGFVDEWVGVPPIVLRPGASGISQSGEFSEQDLEVVLRALWDDEALYIAVEWTDDVWDIQEVRRRDAVFITPDKRRRDRMSFFDNLGVHILELEYDYLLWLSPRVGDEGPFYWLRRLMGLAKRESATPAPVIAPRQKDGKATLELLFRWKDMDIEPKKRQKQGIPLRLTVSDSDSPGLILESKLEKLKSLEWGGRIVLGRKP